MIWLRRNSSLQFVRPITREKKEMKRNSVNARENERRKKNCFDVMNDPIPHTAPKVKKEQANDILKWNPSTELYGRMECWLQCVQIVCVFDIDRFDSLRSTVIYLYHRHECFAMLTPFIRLKRYDGIEMTGFRVRLSSNTLIQIQQPTIWRALWLN